MPGKKKLKEKTQHWKKKTIIRKCKEAMEKIMLILIMILLAVIAAFFLIVYFWYDKKPLNFDIKTIRIETAKDGYAAGSKLSAKSFSVYASDGNKEKLLDSEEYTISPKKCLSMGIVLQ